MTFDDLVQLVEEDGLDKPIRRDFCDWESSRIPALHAKYRKILVYEKIELERMKAGVLPLIKKKRRLYLHGAADKAEEQREGRFDERPDPKLKVPVGENPKSRAKDGVIKDELSFWVDADQDVIAARELVMRQHEKVEYLKDTLDDLRNRSFHINNIIKTQLFKAGLNRLDDSLMRELFEDPD